MAIDWTKGMTQVPRYVDVDPVTWLDVDDVTDVTTCRLMRDHKKPTYESAALEVDGDSWLGTDRIVRCYVDVAQGLDSESVCMGTMAFQSARSSRSGSRLTNQVDGYGLLQDMAQDSPPFGFCVSGDPSDAIGLIVSMSCRAPYVGYEGLQPLAAPIWARDGDSWLTLANAVASEAGCEVVTDPYGRVTLVPTVPSAALRPSWAFGRENCIVLPDTDDETDLFDVPNWCEVTVTSGGLLVVGTAENADPGSPVSTVRRGHRVPMRLTNPDGLSALCTKEDADRFAMRQLVSRSEVQRTRHYRHALCPVTVGNAVTLSFDSEPVVARVESQEIELKTGVEVDEVATYAERMWSR